jgi:hypothetical protein
MTNKKPPTELVATEPHDPYMLRGIEQLFGLFDGGDFLAKVMSGHKDLQLDLLSHMEEHGSKGCKGSMTLKINYALGKSGDVGMGATVDFKAPAKPPSSAAAYINDKGELTLYSPFMARMQQPIRDATPHDPETGEVRDVD